MFRRKIIERLQAWANKKGRKPLVLRGARQVGKTTAVNMFADFFNQYIYLNLDIKEDRELFEQDLTIEDLITAIFLYKSSKRDYGKTLIFIDEIQSSPQAVSSLRYFFESAPELYVIAAGSLLETLIDTHISFPVGRVEYMFMHPLCFEEYLDALGEQNVLDVYNQIPLPQFAHKKINNIFNRFTLLGGMPEIIKNYIETKDIVSLNPIFDNLLTAYLDDVEKYAKNDTMISVIRHTIENSVLEAGSRIKFEGFGNSNYKSREIGEALKILEKAMVVKLIHASTSTEPPLVANRRKSPKLLFLDTGIINYMAGLQNFYFKIEDLASIYKGRIVEHIVSQELRARSTSMLNKLNFWVREKKQSNAEIDFLIQHDCYLIPVEVKSGKTGTLRSLHQFMNQTNHKYAVRLYNGPVAIDEISTPEGKEFKLLNLPYYLAYKIDHYLKWFVKEN